MNNIKLYLGLMKCVCCKYCVCNYVLKDVVYMYFNFWEFIWIKSSVEMIWEYILYLCEGYY